MDKTEIAVALLEWERTQHKADYLKNEITKAVLALGSDVNAGSAHAKFNKGKTFKDYKLAVEELPYALTHMGQAHLKIENLDSKFYKIVCEELEIDAPVLKTTEPTVTLKSDTV